MRWLLVFAALLFGFGALHAETVIERLTSPGPLSMGHANLEGRCTACHTTFHKETRAKQCLDCHKPIARDIATRTRWHGVVSDARSKPCEACHVEHRGGVLTRFDRAGFDHDHQAAWPLTGAHARTPCGLCHRDSIHFRDAPQACVACHVRADVHKGRLGTQCQACHTTGHWRDPVPFDHDRTHYPLTGAHRTTACLGCHKAEQWKGVTTACAGCHLREDVHRGADGPKCESCHQTGSWRTIAFNHDRTTFPLIGAHKAVTCAGCHPRTQPPARAPATCNGCHVKDDVHRGTDGPKCESCHSQKTWKVATFDHAKTGFALDGLHAKVTCVGCHPQSVDKVKVGTRCADCHRADDPHHGSLGFMCERCHKVSGWRIPGLPRIMPVRKGPMSQPKPGPIRDFPRSGLGER